MYWAYALLGNSICDFSVDGRDMARVSMLETGRVYARWFTLMTQSCVISTRLSKYLLIHRINDIISRAWQPDLYTCKAIVVALRAKAYLDQSALFELF